MHYRETKSNKDVALVEAGPGSAAGTAHEGVFKYVARRLRGDQPPPVCDAVGASF